VAWLLGLQNQAYIFYVAVNIHEKRMDKFLDDLIISAKQYLDWFLAFDNLLVLQLLHQILVHCQHFWLRDQQDYLDEEVIDHPKSYLLIIFVFKWSYLDPNERIYILLIWKTTRIIRTPSEMYQRIFIVSFFLHNYVRLILFINWIFLLWIACHIVYFQLVHVSIHKLRSLSDSQIATHIIWN